MADSVEERAHWRAVLRSFDGYMQYHLSANHARRLEFLQLDAEDKAMYQALGFRDKLDAVDEGIRRNAEFIDELIADPVFADVLDQGSDDHAHSHSHSQPHTHSHGSAPKPRTQAENDQAQDKIRSTLRSLVRDWGAQGASEREASYKPCLDALAKYFPHESTRARRRVLVPGCGLGRLAMEIAALGFSSQGNEFSSYMLIASHFMLNQTTAPNSHAIFPYLHSFSNHTSRESLLRRVLIPDVVPADVLKNHTGEFSLLAGDFEEIYGGSSLDGDDGQRGKWSAVVTCFFIDCSRNILSFLRIIYELLEADGVWINIGPLLWHFENSPKNAKGEGSIELGLDEVKALARAVGFEIHDEKQVQTTYTGVPGGMLRHEYSASLSPLDDKPLLIPGGVLDSHKKGS